MLTLKSLKKVHMIGIKGTGMSGLALLLAKLGIQVTGSDAADSFLLLQESNFTKAGITISPDFNAKNISPKLDAIIASSSHLTKNPEIKEAKRLGLQVLTYADVVALLSQTYQSIAICGSHGKTTTTNLLAHVLQKAKTPVLPLAGPTSEQVLEQMGASDTRVFVFEADEYQNKLKQYSAHAVILTNVELDHPDYFKTAKQYENVFINFIKRIPVDGFLVYCADDESATHIASKAKVKTIGYGFGETADYRIRAVTDSETATPFAIHHQGKLLGVFRTPLLGTHNILNSTAVVLASTELGVEQEKIQNGLMSFKGSPRRLQKVSDNPLIYDDYGHHPTEIKSTLQALRSKFQDKTIWTVFHPHTFTRTKAFLQEFGDSFADSDHTIVLEIWGSAREKHGTVSSRDVVAEIKSHGGKAKYAATFEEAAALLKGKLGDDTLLLTIGAGDVWKLHAYVTNRHRRAS